MKKLDVFLIVVTVILLVALIVVSIFLFNATRNNNATNGQASTSTYYGQRGNIKNSEKILFLSKNEDLLTGMIGLEYSTDEMTFTTEQMITFAVYVASERYEAILQTEADVNGVERYIISTEVIDSILDEFFGVTDIIHEVEDHDLYSRSRGYYLLDKTFEKTMWFYPVNEEIVEVTNETNENINTEENVVENVDENTDTSIEENTINILITADSIYIDETKEESEYKNIKYDGMYNEDIVEYTIRFRYDENGKLISYQYIENE